MTFLEFKKRAKKYYEEKGKEEPKESKLKHQYELYIKGHDYNFTK